MKNLKRASSTLLFCILAHSGFAADLAEMSGWRASLAIVPGVFSLQSQFSTEDENSMIPDLYNSGVRTNRVAALPLARLDLTLSDLKTQFFLGNSEDNVTKGQVAMEVGGIHALNDLDRLTFAVFPKLPFSGETWKDPFLTGQKRQITMEKAAGGRIKYEHQGENAFAVQYAYAVNRIDQEESGNSIGRLNNSQRAMLNRNAEFHRLDFNLDCPVNPNLTLAPGFQVTISNAQGDANDFAAGAFKLQALTYLEKQLFSATVSIGRQEANAVDPVNPVFSKPQDDELLAVNGYYQYTGPFGLENWSVIGLAYWEKVDSSISFYSRRMAAIGVGLSYQW